MSKKFISLKQYRKLHKIESTEKGDIDNCFTILEDGSTKPFQYEDFQQYPRDQVEQFVKSATVQKPLYKEVVLAKRVKRAPPEDEPDVYTYQQQPRRKKPKAKSRWHIYNPKFNNLFYNSEDEDDDVDPFQSEFNYQGIFYSWNSTVLVQSGRADFMQQFGIMSMSQNAIQLRMSIPSLSERWIPREVTTPFNHQGTDPFMNYKLDFAPYNEQLSVLRFMSSPSTPDNDEYVSVREVLGVQITMINALEQKMYDNPRCIFPPGDPPQYIDNPYPGSTGCFLGSKNYQAHMFQKTYFSNQIIDNEDLQTLVDKHLNVTSYEEENEFEMNVLRIGDDVIYNAMKQAEPSNIMYSYDDAPDWLANIQIPGVIKVMDYQSSIDVNVSCDYAKAPTTGTQWDNNIVPMHYNKGEMTPKVTRSMNQGNTITVDFTNNGTNVGMLLFQNVMLAQTNTLIQPCLKDLNVDKEVNGRPPNYRQLWSNWIGTPKTTSEPILMIVVMVNDTAIPFTSYQILTGQQPGQQVVFENAAQEAATSFGTIGVNNPAPTTIYTDHKDVTHVVPHDPSIYDKIDPSKHPDKLNDIKHAHVKSVPFPIYATDQMSPQDISEKDIDLVHQGHVLCRHAHTKLMHYAQNPDTARQNRICAAKQVVKYLKEAGLHHDDVDLVTVDHVMQKGSYNKEMLKALEFKDLEEKKLLLEQLIDIQKENKQILKEHLLLMNAALDN